MIAQIEPLRCVQACSTSECELWRQGPECHAMHAGNALVKTDFLFEHATILIMPLLKIGEDICCQIAVRCFVKFKRQGPTELLQDSGRKQGSNIKN